ncbi:MAG TPA: PilZ domain-containing protein [Terriglobales bacterium]|nr:PilZ domain-containing protein [Terriglobales bacterium]
MDPNVLHEQGGLPDGKLGKDAGTSYLRQLKMRNGEGLGVAAAPAPLPAAPKKERRREKRYDCPGSAEIRTEGNSTRLWGMLKDISLNGCYVEMTTTFPVDTRVYVALEAAGIRTVAEAVVRTSYPSLGMGLSFATVAPTQQERLKEILAAAAGRRAAHSSGWRP